MIRLASVYKTRFAEDILYRLLEERTPEQSIRHKRMPTKHEHHDFVESAPYRAWYLAMTNADIPVGMVYLTKQNEIGLFVFNAHQGRGYGPQIYAEMRKRWNGRMLANINPANTRSIRFFEKMGARLIQQTYEIGGVENGKDDD